MFSYCPSCGAKLAQMGSTPGSGGWQHAFSCTGCSTEWLLTSGDAMGGSSDTITRAPPKVADSREESLKPQPHFPKRLSIYLECPVCSARPREACKKDPP